MFDVRFVEIAGFTREKRRVKRKAEEKYVPVVSFILCWTMRVYENLIHSKPRLARFYLLDLGTWYWQALVSVSRKCITENLTFHYKSYKSYAGLSLATEVVLIYIQWQLFFFFCSFPLFHKFVSWKKNSIQVSYCSLKWKWCFQVFRYWTSWHNWNFQSDSGRGNWSKGNLSSKNHSFSNDIHL